MKIFKKIAIAILIQAYLMSNICFAQKDVDTLSPRVMLSSDGLQNLFNPLENDISRFMPHLFKDYDSNVFAEANGDLTLQGRFFVEMGDVCHQLAHDLMSVTLGLDIVDNNEKKSISKYDLAKIQSMSDDLVRINKSLVEIFKNDASIPKRETVIEIIMQANGLRTKYAELVDLRDRISMFKDYANILDKGIKCINFVTEHTDAVLFGVNEEKFNIQDLFKKEKEHKILNSQGLTDSEIFGYRSGLNSVIKNLRTNVFDHAGDKSSGYYVEITQAEGNIIIRYIDDGQGFNIDNLKQTALELKFWNQERSDTATDAEVIDLIFKKGFSRRYEADKSHGLGLWLCRQVVEGYFQGTIIAENVQEHSGSVFIITIPKNRMEIVSLKPKFRRVFHLSAAVIFGVIVYSGIMQYSQEFVGMANQGALNSFVPIPQQFVPGTQKLPLKTVKTNGQNGSKIFQARAIISNQDAIEQSI